MKTLFPVVLLVAALASCHEKTELDRRFDEELAVQTTDEGRKCVTFSHRRAVAFNEHRESFDPSDGIDEFEAWVLADEYRLRVYGVCGATRVPEFTDGRWRVVVVVGDPPPRAQPPIYIDAKSGRLQQIGCEPIDRPAEWLKNPRPPNSEGRVTR